MRTNQSLHGSNTTIFAARRFGYTLVELLVATSLTLVLLGAVAYVFGMVGQTVNESRATLEMTDRLRAVTVRLQKDLEGITVTMKPPVSSETEEGYFEYIEGPNPQYSLNPTERAVPRAGIWPHAANSDQIAADGLPMPDTTVIDHNDILMFTTRSQDEPFVGKAFVLEPNYSGNPANPDPSIAQYTRRYAESQVAEVAWFVRGRTLYRRVLLVLPDFDADLTGRPVSEGRQPAMVRSELAVAAGYPKDTVLPYYMFYDVSVHREEANLTSGSASNLLDDKLVVNSLADLTNPENRFAHQSLKMGSTEWRFPFHPHLSINGRTDAPQPNGWRKLGLPTLRETAHPQWGVHSNAVSYSSNVAGPMPYFPLTIGGEDSNTTQAWGSVSYDLQANPHPFDDQQYADSGALNLDNFDSMHDPDANLDRNAPRTRAEEDVVLENVVGFDVKAWDPEAPVLQDKKLNTILRPGDPGYPYGFYFDTTKNVWKALDNANGESSEFRIVSRGAYVDLNYMNNKDEKFNYIAHDPTQKRCVSFFSNCPHVEYLNDNETLSDLTCPLRLLALNNAPGGTYDTWSTDVNDASGKFDERAKRAPYSSPLRGLKVTVRVYEPYSRKIREVTITQDFMDK